MINSIPVYNDSGAQIHTASLVVNDKKTACSSTITKVINAIRRNLKPVRRAHYKNPSNINKSTRKIRPQKRMGRSRQGSCKALHMRGGAVKFGFSGDTQRDSIRRYRYHAKINKKEKACVLNTVILNKYNNDKIFVVQDENLSVFTKTKKFLSFIDILKIRRPLILYANKTQLWLGAQNLKDSVALNVHNVNIVDFLRYTEIIMNEQTLKILNEQLATYSNENINP